MTDTTLHHAKLFINGEFVDAASAATMPIVDPSTGRSIGALAAAGEVDVDRAVLAAQRTFDEGVWRDKSVHHRAKVLNKFADLFEADIEAFFRLETLGNGRPISETRAQIARLPQFYRYFAALALTRRTDVIPVEGDYLCYTQRVPLGVVALMTSFNHPLMILSKSLAPALATGNSVVIKPSEQTPLTTVRLVALLKEAGVPDGVVNVVNGEGRVAGAALASHPKVKKIVFTGGTDVGRGIGEAAARNFALTTLELGGKGAVIMFDDLDIDRAVNGAAFAAFIGAGQTCVCGARILVQRSMYPKFLEKFKTKVESIRVGDPADPRTQLGPVISERSRARVLAMLDRAVNAGAKVLAGGQVATGAGAGFYIQATALYDVDPDSEIGQEEVFGPVTVVMPFDDEADALRIANGTRFGLAASIWTNDVARAHRVANKLTFGILWINDHHRLDPASPWGGFKQSGVGRETGIESYDQFTEPKAITVNTSGVTVDWYKDDGQAKRLN
ncbi:MULTISPECIES: aldehyde dehydrogenase [unclassified Variovorax]|uniref:aldehyde dehydrogenase n=1 Tax=unclassified Variovorax TaxID=663243 RepID=UPI002B222485|nr:MULTISPECIES: aldehyde dehydrogenase [unclassified Variovorax]MEB0055988.1 aldehyde dehydrogenase [Variovorax sp. LG9.2]MEB0111125.1 aldehyde dehydrogenase [Variovorax sp. RTB1]